MPYVDRIRWQCRIRPQEPALALPSPSQGVVTYAALGRCLNNAGRHVREMGVVPGAVYGLLVKDALVELVLSLALDELGAATMALRDLEIPSAWPFAAILSDREVEDSAWPLVRVDRDWLRGDGRPLEFDRMPSRPPDDICRIVLTSGSTGSPKGVVFTHRTIEERLATLDYAYGETARHDRMMCCIVNAEYRTCLYVLSRGGLYCYPEPSIESTARKIALYRVQTLVAGAATLAAILGSLPSRRTGFRALELIRTTGSRLPPQLAERVRETMCGRLFNQYGTTETGTIATAPVELIDLDAGEVGFLIPGVRLELVDPESRAPVTSGAGLLRVRSPQIASGYFGGGAEAKAFEGGAFRSRDLATLSPDGCVTLLGRDSNIVNLGGDKATIERIELHYAKAPGIDDVAAVPVRDGLGLAKVVAIIVPNEEWSEQKFWEHCRGNLPRTFWPSKLMVAEDLPRGNAGKIDRAKLGSLISRAQ
jgi:acyl-coenzyme A synthetase/AMP-(fatty) acid ligase